MAGEIRNRQRLRAQVRRGRSEAGQLPMIRHSVIAALRLASASTRQAEAAKRCKLAKPSIRRNRPSRWTRSRRSTERRTCGASQAAALPRETETPDAARQSAHAKRPAGLALAIDQTPASHTGRKRLGCRATRAGSKKLRVDRPPHWIESEEARTRSLNSRDRTCNLLITES